MWAAPSRKVGLGVVFLCNFANRTMKDTNEQDLLDFSQSDRLPHQVEHRFLRALTRRVNEELFPGKYQDYVEHFYRCGYHKIVSRRAEQLPRS